MKTTAKVLCISMLFSSKTEKNNGKNLLEIGSDFTITKTSGEKEYFVKKG